MEDKIIDLSWDSEFFGFPVAKLEADKLTAEDLKDIYYKSNAKLIYYFTNSVISEELENNLFFKIKLVDTKVSIRKTLNKNARLHPKISIYDSYEVEPELIQLAYRAGMHSRFFKDELILNSKFEELYKIWITKSVKREMADVILVYRENSKIIGFTTINTSNTNGREPHVTLLAVDPSYEGRGVSFALMHAIENVLISKGFFAIWSETQEENHKAISVYRRHGLAIGEKRYIYHFWRNNL